MYYTANSIKVSACKLGVRETVFRSSCDSDVAIKRVRTTAKYFNIKSYVLFLSLPDCLSSYSYVFPFWLGKFM